jgi:peptide/nickel transport system ATP-binding protein
MTESMLAVRGLTKHYPITEGLLKREVGRVRAVDGVSFSLNRGETLGVVGESGCGKSTVASLLVGLESPTGGDLRFDGEDVTDFSEAERRRFRREVGIVFQDPGGSLDPRLSVGRSVAEPLVVHGIGDRESRRERAADLFERVGLEREDVDRYPHELSGGEKQRAALARALVLEPSLLVLDEPTSALDVSVQAQILSLLQQLQADYDLGVVLISHDLDVVRDVCDRVAVMYLGEFVEVAPTDALFGDPAHPYSRALLGSIPASHPRERGSRKRLSGDVPSPSDPPDGCRFHTRCPEVIPPDGVDLPQREWRAVMDLRLRLDGRGVDADAIREFVVARGDAASVEEVTDAQVTDAVREEFDLPERLADSRVDRVVADALSTVAAGDDGVAATALAEALPTVCERTAPESRSLGPDRRCACHLHE